MPAVLLVISTGTLDDQWRRHVIYMGQIIACHLFEYGATVSVFLCVFICCSSKQNCKRRLFQNTYAMLLVECILAVGITHDGKRYAYRSKGCLFDSWHVRKTDIWQPFSFCGRFARTHPPALGAPLRQTLSIPLLCHLMVILKSVSVISPQVFFNGADPQGQCFTRRTDHELHYLSCLVQAFKTYADDLRPIAQARENMFSSCSCYNSYRVN